MIEMSLQVAAEVVSGRLHGVHGGFRGIAIDSRNISRQALFAALPGQHVDGHNFVASAADSGAAAALVKRPQKTLTLPQIVCDDVEYGLGRLTSYWRSQFKLPVAAVTGSNGKTTVKTMLAAIVSQRFNCLVSAGNLNNELGVPLSLAQLSAEHEVAVIEMGAAKPGDIRYLAELAQPQLGIVTMAAPAHLQGMGDLAGVAKTKGELYQALPADGFAVINADDPHFSQLCEMSSAQIISFGLDQTADFGGHWETSSDGLGGLLDMHCPYGQAKIQLNLMGRHNARNALAAAAAAAALGCGLEEISTGLSQVQPVEGRLCTYRSHAGWCLVRDTYNANPASVRAAIDVLLAMPGEPWLVLGSMAELGSDAEHIHREIGEYAFQSGVQQLLTLGDLAQSSHQAFKGESRHFSHYRELSEYLIGAIEAQTCCLIKGSRGMKMERVADALQTADRGLNKGEVPCC